MLGLFFTLATPAVVTIIAGAAAVAVAVGILIGRWVRHHRPETHASIDVVQAALFGLIGLLLAFGLSLALDRYEDRRAATVSEANAISTVQDSAELLPEPYRSATIDGLTDYINASIGFSTAVPDSSEFRAADATMTVIFADLWSIGGDYAAADPLATIPRFHLEALSDASSAHTERIESLANRVPDEVMALLVLVVLLSLGALSMHLTVVGRGVLPSVAAATVVVLILLTLLDLDRPHRGLITVPDAALVALDDQFDTASGSG